MLRKKRLQLILAVLLVSVFINPIPVYAEETAGEETENSFSVIDPEELDKGIEDIISPTGRSSQTVSVALYYTGTGEYYYYNADQWWYTASLFKLPLIMKISNMQKNDEIDYDHIKLDPDLETIKREVLVYSNNTWGYGLQEKIFQNDLRTIRKNDLSYSIGFDEQDLPKVIT